MGRRDGAVVKIICGCASGGHFSKAPPLTRTIQLSAMEASLSYG